MPSLHTRCSSSKPIKALVSPFLPSLVSSKKAGFHSKVLNEKHTVNARAKPRTSILPVMSFANRKSKSVAQSDTTCSTSRPKARATRKQQCDAEEQPKVPSVFLEISPPGATCEANISQGSAGIWRRTAFTSTVSRKSSCQGHTFRA